MKGIGTRWRALGVTGPNRLFGPDCPYLGDRANAEYEAISGCAVVPTEQGGGGGTKCSHWDEECLGAELMTGSLDNGRLNPLSRITIASLEDLGYEVDYSTADAYGRSDLGAGCTCTRRLRSILDMAHGETQQLGLRSPNTPRRRLSEEMRDHAIGYGRAIMANRTASLSVGRRAELASEKGFSYVGDQVVSVVVEDVDGSIFSVVVTPA